MYKVYKEHKGTTPSYFDQLVGESGNFFDSALRDILQNPLVPLQNGDKLIVVWDTGARIIEYQESTVVKPDWRSHR